MIASGFHRPLRIGVVANVEGATAGGAWTFVTAILQGLKDVRTEHSFVILSESPQQHKAPRLAVDHRLKRYVRPFWLHSGLKTVHQCLFRRRSDGPKFDLLEHQIREHDLDIVWFTAPPGRVVSVPFMTTVWDLAHRTYPYFPEVTVTGWNWTDRESNYQNVLPRASFIVAGTEAGRTEIVNSYGINPSNVIVISFPVPGQSSYPPAASEDAAVLRRLQLNDRFLFYPAQFWPHKNHANLLIALRLLAQSGGPKPLLALTGSDKGNADFVRQSIADLGLQDQVRMLGFVSREDLAALYRNAAALVFPSFLGPDNIPPLEAFAFGCPVLAADVSGAKEQYGDAVLLFDPAAPQQIADAILALWTNDKLRAQLIRSGYAIASVRTPQSYVARVIEVMDHFAAIRASWGRNYRHL